MALQSWKDNLFNQSSETLCGEPKAGEPKAKESDIVISNVKVDIMLSQMRRIANALEGSSSGFDASDLKQKQKQPEPEPQVPDSENDWLEWQSDLRGYLDQAAATLAVIASFLASVDASLLSFSRSIITGRPAGSPAKLSDSIIYSCFFMSIGINMASMVFLTLGAIPPGRLALHLFTQRIRKAASLGGCESARTTFYRRAYGSREAVVMVGFIFLMLSLLAMVVGFLMLVWADFPECVAIAVTASIAFMTLLSIVLLVCIRT